MIPMTGTPKGLNENTMNLLDINDKTKESIYRLYRFLEERKINGRFDLTVELDVDAVTEVIVISDLQGKTDRDEFVIELIGRRRLIRDAGRLLVSNGQRVLIISYIEASSLNF